MESFAECAWKQFAEKVTEDAWQELLSLGSEVSAMPVSEEIEKTVKFMGNKDAEVALGAQKEFCRCIKASFIIEAGLDKLSICDPTEDLRVVNHFAGVAYHYLREGRFDALQQAIGALAKRTKLDLEGENQYHHITLCPRVPSGSDLAEGIFGDEFVMVACVYLP